MVTSRTSAEEQWGRAGFQEPTYRLTAALPGKPEPCLCLTLPISFQFTKAFLKSWLQVGSLNISILISWAPEVGGPTGSSI